MSIGRHWYVEMETHPDIRKINGVGRTLCKQPCGFRTHSPQNRAARNLMIRFQEGINTLTDENSLAKPSIKRAKIHAKCFPVYLFLLMKAWKVATSCPCVQYLSIASRAR